MGEDGEGDCRRGRRWFADVILGVEGMIDSMNKSKEHDFFLVLAIPTTP